MRCLGGDSETPTGIDSVIAVESANSSSIGVGADKIREGKCVVVRTLPDADDGYDMIAAAGLAACHTNDNREAGLHGLKRIFQRGGLGGTFDIYLGIFPGGAVVPVHAIGGKVCVVVEAVSGTHSSSGTAYIFAVLDKPGVVQLVVAFIKAQIRDDLVLRTVPGHGIRTGGGISFSGDSDVGFAGYGGPVCFGQDDLNGVCPDLGKGIWRVAPPEIPAGCVVVDAGIVGRARGHDQEAGPRKLIICGRAHVNVEGLARGRRLGGGKAIAGEIPLDLLVGDVELAGAGGCGSGNCGNGKNRDNSEQKSGETRVFFHFQSSFLKSVYFGWVEMEVHF